MGFYLLIVCLFQYFLLQFTTKYNEFLKEDPILKEEIDVLTEEYTQDYREVFDEDKSEEAIQLELKNLSNEFYTELGIKMGFYYGITTDMADYIRFVLFFAVFTIVLPLKNVLCFVHNYLAKRDYSLIIDDYCDFVIATIVFILLYIYIDWSNTEVPEDIT